MSRAWVGYSNYHRPVSLSDQPIPRFPLAVGHSI
jgi:hypothetical protein